MSNDEIVLELATNILERLPEKLDMEDAKPDMLSVRGPVPTHSPRRYHNSVLERQARDAQCTRPGPHTQPTA